MGNWSAQNGDVYYGGCRESAEWIVMRIRNAEREVERLRAIHSLCLGLLRDRSRITYEWDARQVTMSYFIDAKPSGISLEDALAKAAEAEKAKKGE